MKLENLIKVMSEKVETIVFEDDFTCETTVPYTREEILANEKLLKVNVSDIYLEYEDEVTICANIRNLDI